MNAITTFETNYADENTKSKLIFLISSIYATFVLEEPIHSVGTPFSGSLKVEKNGGEFLCPVNDADRDTSNAVFNICLAGQLDF